jgi:preprotein translocase subunit SecA
VGIADRLKKSFRQLLARPGNTVGLEGYQALLPSIDERGEDLREMSDEELLAIARDLLPSRPAQETADATSGDTDASEAHVEADAEADAEADTEADTAETETIADQKADAVEDADADEPAVAAIKRERIEPAAKLTPEQVVEVCALAREAGRRALGETAFDTQLLGAMAMIDGHVAEMATGEGKTLAAVVAAFGHAVRGSRVHVLTVNDYLARRDAAWMHPVYERLGMTVAPVSETSSHEERLAAYACDVTYVSIGEAGFDFLRDQLIVEANDAVIPALSTVIVDEADSILIDEARVPLVLAGTITDTDADSVATATARLVSSMRPNRDFRVSEDRRNVQLTNRGAAAVERAFGGIDLYSEESLVQLTAVNQALHARALLTRDIDYIVRDGKVALVDEFRGRVRKRRRWPDGLQAAVEAKEGLTTTAEGHVLGSITVQAFVSLYAKVCGMTGTAVRVGDQLREFYQLEVAVIPPNTPNIREDQPDRVYATAEEKEDAIVAEVAEAHEAGRPVLIGTLNVAESERLAEHLLREGVDCVVLNAKNDEDEAALIAEAGRVGAVTVSTQMAGRGIDIRLGGRDMAERDEVAEFGGLYVIGAGRNDSGRVDDQLRGRAGRQGDPGGSVFFVSAEDEMVVLNGGLSYSRADGDGLVTDPEATEAVAHAQRVAEGVAFEIHRNTWKYGVLIERQRQVLAQRRHELLTTDAAAKLVASRSETYDDVVEKVSADAADRAARLIALYHLDQGWADHLAMLADVREGIHLRTLGRENPLDEFHRIAIPAFRELMQSVDDQTVETFDEADLTEEGWAPEESGLVRPSATWTYMVHDNPFGSEMERFIASASRVLLGKR